MKKNLILFEIFYNIGLKIHFTDHTVISKTRVSGKTLPSVIQTKQKTTTNRETDISRTSRAYTNETISALAAAIVKFFN